MQNSTELMLPLPTKLRQPSLCGVVAHTECATGPLTIPNPILNYNDGV